MFFHGKGTVLASERDEYHPNVHVAFSPKAWLNEDTAQRWLTDVLTPYIREYLDDVDWLIVMDNLATQKKKWFVRKIQALRGEIGYGPPNKTQHWQPIDAGHLGAVLKEVARGFFEQWMEGQKDGVPNYERILSFFFF